MKLQPHTSAVRGFRFPPGCRNPPEPRSLCPLPHRSLIPAPLVLETTRCVKSGRRAALTRRACGRTLGAASVWKHERGSKHTAAALVEVQRG